MGPINFVFNDLDRIRPVEKYEAYIQPALKRMVERERGENVPKYGTGYLTDKI